MQMALISFLIFFALTLISSSVGDDDVAYKFFDRKPTGKEALARIRFVIAKVLASLYGGGLMAFFIAQTLARNDLLSSISKNQSILLMMLCIVAVALLIGIVQNFLRLIQGRQQRPIFDQAILKHNLRLFIRPRD